jgi:hypothetical protein
LVEELDRLATALPTSQRVATGAAESNLIPTGQRNSTLANLAGTMRRAGMGQTEVLAAIQATNATRCQPPLPAREVERIAESVARYEPDEVTVALVENHWAQMRITHEIGLASNLGDRFASGEGIQDALFISPCMMFQTDEIDGMLLSINKAKDALKDRHHTWHTIIVPTAKGFEKFFWKLAWFALLVWIIFAH